MATLMQQMDPEVVENQHCSHKEHETNTGNLAAKILSNKEMWRQESNGRNQSEHVNQLKIRKQRRGSINKHGF